MSSFDRTEKRSSVFFIESPKMMQQVYKTLPDDDPILSLCVVEDTGKCPQGYCVVNRTHDQDSDADLYRQSVLFGKRPTRYLCLSKVHGIADLIVEAIIVVGEKDLPPPNYCTIPKTMDSEQKAWRKAQLCYRLNKRSAATSVVTDIILLSRMKKAPEGFRHAGEINGLTLCYKTGPAQSPKQITRPAPPIPVSPNLGYSINPSSTPAPIPPPRRAPVELPLSNGANPPSPVLTGENGSPHEYDRLITLAPLRPAPKPPGSLNPNYATISSYQGIHTSEKISRVKSLPVLPDFATCETSNASISEVAKDTKSRPAAKLWILKYYKVIAERNLCSVETENSFVQSVESPQSQGKSLEGVPFKLHERLKTDPQLLQVPSIKFRTREEINKEFSYDFKTEREAEACS